MRKTNNFSCSKIEEFFQIVLDALNKFMGCPNTFHSKNILLDFSKNVNNIINLTNKQKEDLQEQYKKTITTLKAVDEKTIYDVGCGVYNRKYFSLSNTNIKAISALYLEKRSKKWI